MRACAGKSKTHVVTRATRSPAPRARSTHARRTGTRRTAPPPAPHAPAAGSDAARQGHGLCAVMRSWSAHSDRAVRPACRPRCPTGRFEDERLSAHASTSSCGCIARCGGRAFLHTRDGLPVALRGGPRLALASWRRLRFVFTVRLHAATAKPALDAATTEATLDAATAKATID